MTETFKNNLTNEEKIIYLKVLSCFLNHGKCNDAVLLKKIDEIKIPAQNIKNLKKISRPESISNELLKIKDLRLRRYFIREMIMFAVADHELSDEEICDLYKIAISVGIKEDKVNDFFLWAAQGVEWQLEGKRLVEEDL